MHRCRIVLYYSLWTILITLTKDIEGKRQEIDPCEDDSERHLHDMHRRFKNYKTMFQRRQEEMVCDKYLIPQHGAWFMSYNDMPTEPPTFLDCGTTHPIWLKGTIPTISEGVVNRTACKVGFMSYCDEKIPVKIKRCEKYTAYFLLPTKHCPEAYCFGIKKDPPLPKPVVKPSGYNENESSVDRLQFECYMNISSLNFAYYEITWRWGISSLTLKNESSQFSNLRLTDEHFKTFGVHITCTVKALHFEHDVMGLNATSNKFYAGLKFPDHIRIQKGEVVIVPYQLTIPLSCQLEDICGINVNVLIKKETELDRCDGQLYAIPRRNNLTDIMQDNWNTTHHIEMKHIGRKGYGVKPSSFAVEIHVDLSRSNFHHHEHIPLIQVYVRDSDSNHKVCSAHNDPHMKTFDGLSYEHQQPGTYILYEHSKLERHMQVQMELAPCNSDRAFCICGLAVRAGGDIFVIYVCGGKTIIKYGTCSDKILKVKRAKRNTKQYKITFPTGTEISANIFLHGSYGGTMNVEVRGSGDDKGQSQGLCGRMTGHITDNMLIRGTNKTDNTGSSWTKFPTFSDSWRKVLHC
ncbi:von Willebrand factor D and EGF domain-containing protein-like [Mytilus edulis]|uniref:von Willebrand factor D and EGF domain-containing protein-like n=1 Tax=Mytilus edulis TaxID=6550 RepID=UPI0039EE9661